MMADVTPLKDEATAHPVPSAWRESLRQVVHAFVEKDYSLSRGIQSVSPIKEAVARQVSSFIEYYGEQLVELPDDTWSSSVCQWMRNHWVLVVDLWTAESGPSDLVLNALVFESPDGVKIEVASVTVP